MLPAAISLIALALLAGFSLGGLLALWSHCVPAVLRRRWRGQDAARVAPAARPAGWSRACPGIGWRLTSRRLRRRAGWTTPWPELLLAALFGGCLWRYGMGWLAWAAMAYCLALALMAWIDWRSYLLPDMLTLPLMWAGLLVNLGGAFAPPIHALAGLVVGYGFLWLFFQAFRRITGREGMGQGDFKLMAALGAWLGVEMLLPVLLLSSLLGVVAGVWDRVRRGHDRPQPFAPCLALAGVCVLWWRPEGLAWF